MSDLLSRRSVLAAGVASFTCGAIVRPAAAVDAPVKPGLRIAHLTDMHVKPEARAGEGYAAALQSLAKLSPQPAFLVTGGDHVMDVMASTRQRADVQWSLYHKVLSENTKLKTHPVVGNHDVFGWQSKEPLDESAEGYGKAMSRDQLGLKQTHYSFDSGAWHFVVLDNIARREGSYYGDLDPEQTEWLTADLAAAAGKPVCVFSHIPLVSVCALFFNQKPKEFWRVGDHLLHRDVRPLLKILAAGGVRLCVSGHIHLLDRVRFMDIDFICDGAVSGSWWGGAFQHVPEGYGVFDLHDDGTWEHQYVTYGWEAEKK
jgi:3',5'-cyclic AMP phosphodiesterase CpdA